MATSPERDPDREEMEAVLAAHPGLREHLDDLVDQSFAATSRSSTTRSLVGSLTR